VNDWANRTVKGVEAGSTAANYGVMADHAERDQTRTGFDIEVTPSSKVGLTFEYARRNADYKNRPNRVPNDTTQQTADGLLSAKYDSFTGEVDFTPNPKLELSAYYTYEKDAQTNQGVTTTGTYPNTALNSKLVWAGSDKTNTFGLNFVYTIVPDKWKFRLMARQQKLNGLMDITANESGTFYNPGRTTLVAPGQGGAGDIDGWDDTTLTTFGIQLDRAIGKAWNLSGGYAYEKYDFTNDMTSGTEYSPVESTRVDYFLKLDNGAYKANVAYAKLTYRF
jgi:hypothetical protein